MRRSIQPSSRQLREVDPSHPPAALSRESGRRQAFQRKALPATVNVARYRQRVWRAPRWMNKRGRRVLQGLAVPVVAPLARFAQARQRQRVTARGAAREES